MSQAESWARIRALFDEVAELGAVESEQVDVGGSLDRQIVGELDPDRAPGSLLRSTLARVVDQDPADQPRRHREELASVLPSARRSADPRRPRAIRRRELLTTRPGRAGQLGSEATSP